MSAPCFSIVTPNRDRLEPLRHVIGSWQSCPDVGEIIVVDFGSHEPIKPAHFPRAEKLRIVRVVNADCWRIGLAINIGVDQAASELICKLDSDILIRDSSMLARLDLEGAFYRGRDGSGISHGQTCFQKQSWSRVGGYNEWLSGYGFDDSDFYQRLRFTGLAERSFEQEALTEIQQTFETRAAAEYHSEMPTLNLTDASTRMCYMQSRNTYLAMLRRWSPALRLPYTQQRGADGISTIVLKGRDGEYRWAEALASYLAVVRLSGTAHNIELLNSLVLKYLSEVGGF